MIEWTVRRNSVLPERAVYECFAGTPQHTMIIEVADGQYVVWSAAHGIPIDADGVPLLTAQLKAFEVLGVEP